MGKTRERASRSAEAAGGAPSAKRLRALLRTSPLIPPEVRTHWLRVLPHLTAEQRAELAALLEASATVQAPPPAS
jgi:hypothetical protein